MKNYSQTNLGELLPDQVNGVDQWAGTTEWGGAHSSVLEHMGGMQKVPGSIHSIFSSRFSGGGWCDSPDKTLENGRQSELMVLSTMDG